MIEGRRLDGSELKGEYLTGKFEEREITRTISQLGFAEGRDLDLAGRRDVARLIEGVTRNAVSGTNPWHLEADGTV